MLPSGPLPWHWKHLAMIGVDGWPYAVVKVSDRAAEDAGVGFRETAEVSERVYLDALMLGIVDPCVLIRVYDGPLPPMRAGALMVERIAQLRGDGLHYAHVSGRPRLDLAQWLADSQLPFASALGSPALGGRGFHLVMRRHSAIARDERPRPEP